MIIIVLTITIIMMIMMMTMMTMMMILVNSKMIIIIIIDCGPLSLISNGTATLDVPSTSTFGATASINCTAGYEASKTSISCKGNGKWTKSSCIIKGEFHIA
jgi:hypothetical protein